MYRSVSLMCCYRCVFFAALYRNHVLRHVSLCISMHVHRVGHNIAIALCLKDRFRYYFVCLCVCVAIALCLMHRYRCCCLCRYGCDHATVGMCRRRSCYASLG